MQTFISGGLCGLPPALLQELLVLELVHLDV